MGIVCGTTNKKYWSNIQQLQLRGHGNLKPSVHTQKNQLSYGAATHLVSESSYSWVLNKYTF